MCVYAWWNFSFLQNSSISRRGSSLWTVPKTFTESESKQHTTGTQYQTGKLLQIARQAVRWVSRLVHWVLRCLLGRLLGLLLGLLFGRLLGLLLAWLVYCLASRLVGSLVGRFRSVDWCRLVDCLIYGAIGRSVGWTIVQNIFYLITWIYIHCERTRSLSHHTFVGDDLQRRF